MTKFNLLSLGLAGALAAVSTSAHSVEFINGCSYDPGTKDTHVYFINGVGMTYSEAEAALAKLMVGVDEPSYLYRMSYREGEVALAGVYDELSSTLRDYAGIDTDAVTGKIVADWFAQGIGLEHAQAFIRASIHTTDADADSIIELLTDDVWSELQEVYARGYTEALNKVSEPSTTHLNYYESDLLAGNRVVLVSYSHGSLTLTKALDELDERQPTRMESVGAFYIAPTSPVTVDTNYISLTNDEALNRLREAGVAVPQGNVTYDVAATADILNHGFSTSYYAQGSDSYTAINTALRAFDESLAIPTSASGVGALRANISWTEYGTTDTYVMEPTGEIINYYNMESDAGIGEIDRDVTRGYGPENYYVPCGNLVEGTYLIGASYYRARSAYDNWRHNDVTLTLSLGNGMLPEPVTHRFPQTEPDTPVWMMEVNVSKDENGNVFYDYKPLVEPFTPDE